MYANRRNFRVFGEIGSRNTIVMSENVQYLLIIFGLMSRATFAIGRGFLSGNRLMDDREWPRERRSSSLT